MKISQIVAAVENGATWQFRDTPLCEWREHSKPDLHNLFYVLGYNKIVRLTPAKKTVPLGPEDWDGIWWIRASTKWANKHMIIGVTPCSIIIHSGPMTYDNAKDEWQRSRDGKTWEPCSKTVEE